MFERRLRSQLDLLMPSVAARVKVKQQQQKLNHDVICKLREFDVGDPVYIRNFKGTPLWLPAVVDQCRGPVSYSVTLQNGTVVKRHVDHIKGRQASTMKLLNQMKISIPLVLTLGTHHFLLNHQLLSSPADQTTRDVLLSVTLLW